jgi:hypothetical protein
MQIYSLHVNPTFPQILLKQIKNPEDVCDQQELWKA